jgi:Asp-tRNA(Asn)/Glu-tRNA(Gln) amidotransferase A subunit family amidase
VPVVAVPGEVGGVQVAAARGNDEALLQLAAQLGAMRKRTTSGRRA